jgi:uridine kinase
MKGDIIIVEDHHRRAADAIVERIVPGILARERRSTITVAGESGSGKSETGQALADALEARGIHAVVFGQDDYFVLPPKSNDARRRQDISWVGTGEVRLDLLDEHLAAVRDGADSVSKPLVIYDEDRVTEEAVDLTGARVAIAEGTYTTLLRNVDMRVFIARDRLETLEARVRRGREQFDPYIENVLEIEHGIISAHRARADVVLSRDYEVEFVAPSETD